MRVTTTELHELIRLLEIHPEWRVELRRILLTEELLDLPKVVKELAEAQRRTEEALTKLTDRMEKGFAEAAEDRKRIWEAIREIADRMEKGFAEAAEDRKGIWEAIRKIADRMEKGFAEAAEDRKGIWEAIREIADRMEKGFAEAAEDRKRIWEAMKKGFMEAAEDRRKIWETIETLAKRMDMVYEDVARLKGISLELRYARRAPAIFGRVITRGRDLTSRLANTLHKAYQEKRISERDVESVLATDILWGGKCREDGKDVALVMEVSWVVDFIDVDRAAWRSKVLERIGIRALPVAAGEVWRDKAQELASSAKVVMLEKGSLNIESWQKALEARLRDS